MTRLNMDSVLRTNVLMRCIDLTRVGEKYIIVA